MLFFESTCSKFLQTAISVVSDRSVKEFAFFDGKSCKVEFGIRDNFLSKWYSWISFHMNASRFLDQYFEINCRKANRWGKDGPFYSICEGPANLQLNYD